MNTYTWMRLVCIQKTLQEYIYKLTFLHWRPSFPFPLFETPATTRHWLVSLPDSPCLGRSSLPSGRKSSLPSGRKSMAVSSSVTTVHHYRRLLPDAAAVSFWSLRQNSWYAVHQWQIFENREFSLARCSYAAAEWAHGQHVRRHLAELYPRVPC